MKCKHCEAELQEGTKICSSCGAELEPEGIVEEAVALNETEQNSEETETVTETAEETETVADTEQKPDLAAEKKPKKKIAWQTVVAIIACVLAMACLGVALASAVAGVSIGSLGIGIATFFNIRGWFEEKEETKEPTEAVVENVNVGTYVSDVDYTGTDEEAKKAADKVVATMNGIELTNGELQIYYGLLVNDFLNNYYQYIEQLGLDLTVDLNTQVCYFDENMSWEAYFVENAITTWQNHTAVYLAAEEAGFVLSAEMEESLSKMPDELKTMAEGDGYESVDALIQARMGGYCTLEDYMAYSRAYFTGAEYTSQLPSDKELNTYFDENSEMFSEYGITKESGPMVDVRHILLQPDGGTANEDGTTTYSDAEWKACLEAAEAVYKEWKDGAATEASFAELANQHSTDPGSNTNGGLYSQITSETTFVEPFLSWCMDEDRKVGDTGIVQTDYGYHIMYFSASEPVWLYYAKSQYISDQTTGIMENALEKWTAEINNANVCLVAVNVA